MAQACGITVGYGAEQGHGECAVDPGLKFAGQLLDEESGLFYNRYRYYLAEAGCYLTPDPIGLAGREYLRICT